MGRVVNKRAVVYNSRDLEQELFRFYFENASNQAVLHVLSNYQGEGGGFKNMGEGHPNFTNAMDTTMAFQYLSEVGATSKDEIVQKGIQYIVNSYDRSLNCWHPRPNETFIEWGDNPDAELVGFLYEYRDLVPNDFLKHARCMKQSRTMSSAVCKMKLKPNPKKVISFSTGIRTQKAKGFGKAFGQWMH